MEKILQRFDLNLEEMTKILEKENKEKLPRLNYHAAFNLIVDALKNAGYEIYESNSNYNGVPGSVIVSGPIKDMNHKRDFYYLVEKMKLPFGSEAFYTKR